MKIISNKISFKNFLEENENIIFNFKEDSLESIMFLNVLFKYFYHNVKRANRPFYLQWRFSYNRYEIVNSGYGLTNLGIDFDNNNIKFIDYENN